MTARRLAPIACALLMGAAVFGVALAGDEPKAPQPASLSGTLRDAKGKPVAGASVSVEGGAPVRSAADGTWTIPKVDPGDALVIVKAMGHGHVQAQLHVAAGESRRWDATLGKAGVLDGRLVDEYGNPLTLAPGVDGFCGWWVGAMPEQRWLGTMPAYSESWSQRTDANGCFRLRVATDAMFRLWVFVRRSRDNGARVLVTEPMSGGISDITLRVLPSSMPHARLHVRLEDNDGTAVPGGSASNMNVELCQDDWYWTAARFSYDQAKHEWISAPVPPGAYTIAAYGARGRAFEFRSVEVRDAADVDVGTLRFPPTGRVRFAAARSGPGSGAVVHVGVRRVRSFDELGYWHHEVGWWSSGPDLTGDSVSEANLCPGRYYAYIQGMEAPPKEQRHVQVEIPFEVRAGETTDVTIPVQGAPLRFIDPRYAGRTPSRTFIVISDASGTVVWRWWDTNPGESEFPCCLLPGRHSFIALTPDGRRLKATLDIPEENAPAQFEVVLR